jgi:hypothetical protein
MATMVDDSLWFERRRWLIAAVLSMDDDGGGFAW